MATESGRFNVHDCLWMPSGLRRHRRVWSSNLASPGRTASAAAQYSIRAALKTRLGQDGDDVGPGGRSGVAHPEAMSSRHPPPPLGTNFVGNSAAGYSRRFRNIPRGRLSVIISCRDFVTVLCTTATR